MQKLGQLSKNALMDSILISICFENYLKAILLFKGFVIHNINKEAPTLRSKQRKSPVSISELHSHEPIPENITDENGSVRHTIQCLDRYTIGLKKILSEPDYRSLFTEIDGNLEAIIRSYYDERNELHYMGTTLNSYGESKIKDVETMIDFVNENVVVRSNKLMDDFTNKYSNNVFNGWKLSKIPK